MFFNKCHNNSSKCYYSPLFFASAKNTYYQHFSLRCQRKMLAKFFNAELKWVKIAILVARNYTKANALPINHEKTLCSISAPKSKVQVYPDAALAIVVNLSARTSLQLLRSSPVEYDRAVKPCNMLIGVVSTKTLYPRADMNGTLC